MTEEWRPVPGFESYYSVSNEGRVRSEPRVVPHRRSRFLTLKGRMLKQVEARRGYLIVTLTRDERREHRRVHRLVLEAFVGTCPPGHEVRHLDGNPANNNLTNLVYGTSAENKLDTLRHGNHHQASKTHCPQGHPYDEKNTLVRPGHRRCRACGYARRRRQLERERESMVIGDKVVRTRD